MAAIVVADMAGETEGERSRFYAGEPRHRESRRRIGGRPIVKEGAT
jgi:hypothetical protein